MTTASTIDLLPAPWPAATGPGYLGNARIAGPRAADGTVPLRLCASDETEIVRGVVAAAVAAAPLAPGDEVLVAGSDPAHLWVLAAPCRSSAGGTESPPVPSSEPPGAAAPGDVLRLESPGGGLVVEYDAAQRRARVAVEAGDLELCAAGDLSVRAGQRLRISAADLVLEGTRSTRLCSGRSQAGAGAELRLEPGQARLAASSAEVVAGRADFLVGEARFAGKRFTAAMESIALTAQRLELGARTLFERVRDVYCKVEGLFQLEADRQRTLVAGTVYARSKRALVKTEEDYKVKAESIHLG